MNSRLLAAVFLLTTCHCFPRQDLEVDLLRDHVQDLEDVPLSRALINMPLTFYQCGKKLIDLIDYRERLIEL